jgi:glucose-6-phosphate dehydrogenase assembly protein OpcA
MSAPSDPIVFGMPVPLHQVERELDRQLKGQTVVGQAPVQRVRMSNLVIYTDKAETARELAAQVPDIVPVHPARVLLLVGEPKATGDQITASVLVRCRVVSKSQQACAEQVTLSAPGPLIDRLPFAVRALLVGDLPTNIWWSSTTPPPLAGPLLYELSEPAQQIMVDTLGWPDPARGMAAMYNWIERTERFEAGHWRVTSDLNWRRLKYWRRLIGQALDPATAEEASRTVTDVLVEHGPHAVVQAWELASWMAQRLGWKLQAGKTEGGVVMSWRFATAQGQVMVHVRRLDAGPPEVRRLRIACTLKGHPVTLNLVAEDSARLAIQLEGVEGEPRTVALPPITPTELIGRQLSDRDRDPVFRESMAVAQAMAQSVLR